MLAAAGAAAPFRHLDVLVSSPEDLAVALVDYPVVHEPDQVDTSLSVLWSMAGDAVPRSLPGRPPRERSVAELESIKARPAPRATPQPWRQWSVPDGDET